MTKEDILYRGIEDALNIEFDYEQDYDLAAYQNLANMNDALIKENEKIRKILFKARYAFWVEYIKEKTNAPEEDIKLLMDGKKKISEIIRILNLVKLAEQGKAIESKNG